MSVDPRHEQGEWNGLLKKALTPEGRDCRDDEEAVLDWHKRKAESLCGNEYRATVGARRFTDQSIVCRTNVAYQLLTIVGGYA